MDPRMDPRLLHDIVDNVLQCALLDTRPTGSTKPGENKRHAVYFPARPELKARLAMLADDNESTWEFSASMSHRSLWSDETSRSSISPAQEIASQYRAGLNLDFTSARTRRYSTFSSGDLSWETDVDDDIEVKDDSSSEWQYVQCKPEDDLRAVLRHSRHEALLETQAEALRIMTEHGLKETDAVVCNRPGCRDTLQGLKGLMYHLDIHNISDRGIVCPPDDQGRDDIDDDHSCRCYPRTPPLSPIKEGFLRLISSIIGQNAH